MTQKIEKLTEEQEAKMPEYVEKWCKIGLNCDPTDYDESKVHVLAAYKEADLALPKHVILVDSPWAAAVVASIFQNMSLDQIAEWCRTPTLAQEELFPTFCPDESTYIIKGKTSSVTKEALRDGITAQVYGSHDAGWLSFYDFCSEELGLADVVKPLQPWLKLARTCGWWAPYEDVCILTHRHMEVHLDDQQRLSNNKGLAVKYRDGSGIWVIDGLPVDKQIVMHPETQTLAQMESETSADIKAIRMFQYGWPKYIEESGATVLDKQPNDVEGTLEVLCKLKDGSHKLLTTCAKGITVVMGVSDWCQTCEQVRDWLSPVAGLNIVGRT